MITNNKRQEEAYAFYREALDLLNNNGAKYMLGGAFALFRYTGICRDTKDLDIFCRFDEYGKILPVLSKHGYKTELTDIRWLAKAFHGEHYIDIIFSSHNNICRVDDDWFRYAVPAEFDGIDVLVMPPEELIWCKIYVQNRERYDGADINHIILKYGQHLDWNRLLSRLNHHWQLLLAQLLLFQFVYPADFHDIIPRRVFDELMHRAHDQYKLPASREKVCLGPLLDQTQYGIDIREWDYRSNTLRTV